MWFLGGAALCVAVALQGCGGTPAPTPATIFADEADEGFAGGSTTYATALADVDGDNDMDLLVTNSEQSNQLFLNNGQGAFEEVTETSGLADAEATSRAAVFADVNGDGLLDVFISSRAHTNRLFHGDGTGKFTDMTFEAGLNNTDFGQGACFADVDADGDMDLFVANFEQSNLFYLNNGNGVFEDVTEAAGLRTEAGGFGCVFGDFDLDGDVDLYVNHEGVFNKLYWNDGAGVFTEQADGDHKVHTGRKRGVQMADFNGDGRPDLIALVINEVPRLLFGALLGIGKDQPGFSDVTATSGLQATGIGQGINVLDFDADGDMDILVSSVNAPNILWENDGSGSFTDVTARAGIGTDRFGQGIAVGDLNNDGRVDVVLGSWGHYPPPCSNCSAANMLLVNKLQSEHAWLKVRVLRPNGHATHHGSKVRVRKCSEDVVVVGVEQYIDSGSGFCGQNAYEAYFGLTTAVAAGDNLFKVEVKCGDEWEDPQEVAGACLTPNQLVEVTCNPPGAVAASLVAHV